MVVSYVLYDDNEHFSTQDIKYNQAANKPKPKHNTLKTGTEIPGDSQNRNQLTAVQIKVKHGQRIDVVATTATRTATLLKRIDVVEGERWKWG